MNEIYHQFNRYYAYYDKVFILESYFVALAKSCMQNNDIEIFHLHSRYQYPFVAIFVDTELQGNVDVVSLTVVVPEIWNILEIPKMKICKILILYGENEFLVEMCKSQLITEMQ